MSSPQLELSSNSSYLICEDELQEASDPLNAKEVMKILKLFSSLGALHSKMNFLFSCVSSNLVPTGFKLKWSEQTGFDSTQLKEATSKCLLQTSLDLQKLVLRASHSQLTASLDYIFGLQHRIPSFYWSKGMKNYQFIFNQCTLKHQKKLRDIAAGSQLKQMFPTLNLSSKLTCTVKSVRDFPVLNTIDESVAVGPSYESTLGALAVPRTFTEESIVTLSSPH